VFAVLIPAPAAFAQSGELQLTKSEVATIVKGTGGWVALTWTAAGGDIAGVRMTVVSQTKGVDVTYPANTGDHVSLWDNDTLVDGELDFTAFYLDVDETVNGKDAKLRVEVEMVIDGKRATDNFTVKVPVVAHSGASIEQVTDDAGTVPAGESRWVEVAFTGLAPTTSNVSTAVSASGLEIAYPGEGVSTSLHHDAQLDFGETDVVRFLVDAESTEPGNYRIDLETSFDGGSVPGVVSLEIVSSS